MAERDGCDDLKCRGCGKTIMPGKGRYVHNGCEEGPFCSECVDKRKKERGEIGPGPITK